jgi:hypothetical protein
MAKVNISEAIQLSKVSRQTFYSKYLNPGKIATELDHQGKKCIDTAELLRVFGSIDLDTVDKTETIKDRQVQTVRDSSHDAEIALLREQLGAAQERERWYQGQLESLTGAIKLLEHRVGDPQAQAPRRGFWSRVFGGAA